MKSTPPTNRELLNIAQSQDLGMGKANANQLNIHLQLKPQNGPEDQKMVELLFHAIAYCPGQHLQTKHLEWRDLAKGQI